MKCRICGHSTHYSLGICGPCQSAEQPSTECGAEFERQLGTTPQRYLCTLDPGHKGDHYDSYGPLRWSAVTGGLTLNPTEATAQNAPSPTRSDAGE